MQNNFFHQKSAFLNTANWQASGVYNIISLNSSIELLQNKFNSNEPILALNNSKLINNNYDTITISNINNSNMTFLRGSYIVKSQNYGGLVNFPTPLYLSLYATEFSNYNSVLVPSDYPTASKLIVSNGLTTFFNLLKYSTLYTNLTFLFASNGYLTIKSNNNIVKVYNLYTLKYSLKSVIENLPKNLNSYNYNFIFNRMPSDILYFEDFYGGNIDIKYKASGYTCIFFKNCSNININGSNKSNTLKNGYMVFRFDDCFNVKINNLNLCLESVNSYTIDGNINKYNTASLCVFKNCNVLINNCYFEYTGSLLTCYIIGFNSKIYLNNVTHSNNPYFKILLDLFSLATLNKDLTSIATCVLNIENANIAINPTLNKYINNGLYNHFHTDYLIEQPGTPVNTVVAYKYWYRKYLYDKYVSSLISATNLSLTEVSGMASILASNLFNDFPQTILPMCCSKDNATKIFNTTSILSSAYNSFITGMYSSALFENNNSPFTNTIQLNKYYDFSNNILLSSMFYTNGLIRTSPKIFSDILTYTLELHTIDNHSIKESQPVYINGGDTVTFKYNSNPIQTCSNSGGLSATHAFIKRLYCDINLNHLISAAIGLLVMQSPKVYDYINNDFSNLSLYEIKSYNTIFNNSYLYIGSKYKYTIKSILLIYLINKNPNFNINVMQFHENGKCDSYPYLDILDISEYFPIYFNICLFPIKTIINMNNINEQNIFLNMSTFKASLLFDDTKSLVRI